MLHTIRYAKMLETVGFSRPQAETSIQVLVEIMDEKFVTKEDLKLALHELEVKLTLRMGAMLVAALSIQTAILKLT